MGNNALQTTHKLDFECAKIPYGFLFRIGTCEGQWGVTEDSFFIMSVINRQQGNGHLDDVFEWFEFSAKRDGRNLLVVECLNKRFYDHLLQKRGFIPLDAASENCVKVFNEKLYRQLLENGNEIIIKGTLQCV